MIALFSLLLVSFFLPPPPLPPQKPIGQKPYIQGVLHNQLGNQMFEIAATVSLALDNDAIAVFPELKNDRKMSWWKFSTNHRYVFWRLNIEQPKRPSAFSFQHFGSTYQEIPYESDMLLSGYFQSEKYFSHHKEEILDLFEPHPSLLDYIYRKYPWLKTASKTVAVHVRCYWPHLPNGSPDGQGVLSTPSPEWFEQAILQFPSDHTFVVFSNNIPWCKAHLTHIPRRFVFMEGDPHFVDLFAMSLCEHNIISNSSFSWWGAYLNKNPDKIVIAPKKWFDKESNLDSSDIVPEGWIIQD